jgi:hypothetical protein
VQAELVPGRAPLPTVAKVPAAHAWHAVAWPATLKVPAAQAAQLEAPGAAEDCLKPALHWHLV